VSILASAPAEVQLIRSFYRSSGHLEQLPEPDATRASDFGPCTQGVIKPPKDLLPKEWFSKGGEFAPLSPSGALGLVFGRSAAALLSQIHHWLQGSKKAHGGHVWIYNTAEQWAKQLGLSISTIKRAVKALRQLGAIKVERYEAHDWQQRNWYAIDYQQVTVIAFEGLKRREIASGQNEPIKSVTLTPSNGAFWFDQIQEPTLKKKPSRKQQQPAAKISSSTATDLTSVLEVKPSRVEQPQPRGRAPEPELAGGVAVDPATAIDLGTGAGKTGETTTGPNIAPKLTAQQPAAKTPAAPTPAEAKDLSTHSDKARATTNRADAKQNDAPPRDFLVWSEKMLGFGLNSQHKAVIQRRWAESGRSGCEAAILAVCEQLSGGQCQNPLALLTAALAGGWEPKERPKAQGILQEVKEWIELARAVGIILATRGTSDGIEALTSEGWEPIEVTMAPWPLATLLQHPGLPAGLVASSQYQAMCDRYGIARTQQQTPSYGPPPPGLRERVLASIAA
jgi:hypothetical protein